MPLFLILPTMNLSTTKPTVLPRARWIKFWGISLLFLLQQQIHAQTPAIPSFPFSNTADEGCRSCYDTVKFLMVQRIFDLSLLLPEWKPVVDWAHVEAVEGIVVPYNEEYTGTHVSQEDFSAYHYTHDFGFNVRPDSAFRRLLARRIYTGFEVEHPTGHIDTAIDDNIHVEWESGLGIDSQDNPCAEANRRGESCGFFSAGHQRGEVIWNWPSMGDWVHCEGTWIWDRGHPPARTELHPLRFCATKRAMLSKIPITPQSTDSVLATRVDLFASGDGGALHNNRASRPSYGHATQMSQQDYVFDLPLDMPKLSQDVTRPMTPIPLLKYRFETQRGDTYTGEAKIVEQENGLRITIPWKGLADDLVFARTLYCWWENEDRKAVIPEAQAIDIHFDKIHFKQRKDVTSRPEKVLWIEAGGQYYCLNEFVKGENIFRDGEAKTYRRDWKIDKTLRVYAPAGSVFRVHVGGWENDGISRMYGDLMDPEMPCTKATKKAFHKHLWAATPFGLHGCLDDLIGEVHDFHAVDTLPEMLEIEVKSYGRDNELEQCPGANIEQNGVFTLWYSIRKVKEE
jgi:hypothetical protein